MSGHLIISIRYQISKGLKRVIKHTFCACICLLSLGKHRFFKRLLSAISWPVI
ncbi:hypothetical protein HanXRQr2_Chr04g0179621 [Helianthus annuus]|uniref:Uncharacterized protein n=1 Tax=Helianthus annuus TaxID=4232 RepID=A0A9K3NTF1_HELAN|nr:hypothetical protein HanXRQr2_Chr04g0179621 [Helianthus annuus]